MRSNKINKLVPLLKHIPEGTPCMHVYYAHIVAVLERNNRNRTITAAELKICLRSLRNKIVEARIMGFHVPKGYLGGQVTQMKLLREKNARIKDNYIPLPLLRE